MTNDRPTVPSPPAADPPLGIQRPFLPSMPLGQSMLQPKFLTPLGAQPLSILQPAIFSSGDADGVAEESPFQDSPFFDSPTPARSPDLCLDPDQTPTASPRIQPCDQPTI